MPLEALIFDVDGTLAETEEAHRGAFNAAFAAAGLDWHWDSALYAQLLEVTGGKERIRRYLDLNPNTPQLDSAAIQSLHTAKTAHYVAAVPSIPLRPGIHRLLQEARAANLRLAIATTTSPANVDALLQSTLGPTGPNWFEVIGAGDIVPHKKPAPDIYQHVLHRLNLPPNHCLAIEDTPNGLKAAQAAGIPTLITPSLYGGQTGFETALQVINDRTELNLPTLHRLFQPPRRVECLSGIPPTPPRQEPT